MVSRKLQKDFRYTLGENIGNELVQMMVLLYKANAADDKAPYIEKMREIYGN